VPVLFRKQFRFGPYRANMSKTGVSHTVKVGPWSYNSRQRRHRVDLPGPFAWTSRKRAARPKRPGRAALIALLTAVALILGGAWAWRHAADWVQHRQQTACTTQQHPPPGAC
jgi:hypothetical protein